MTGVGQQPTMRVATWNIWWRFGADPAGRFEGIARELAESAADVICLQEVYIDRSGNDAQRLGERLGYEAIITDTLGEREQSMGNAVLSRWPVTEHGEVRLPGSDGRPGVRRALWVRVAAPTGTVTVICTHLAYRFDESALRSTQLEAVMALADELRSTPPEESPPVILAGDLNAVPDSDEIKMLTGRRPVPAPGLVFVDCWPQVSDDRGHTWVRRNPHLHDAVWPERRLDYVLTSWPRDKAIGRTVTARLLGDGPVDGVWPSDHLGVVVDLTTVAIRV